LKRSGSIGRRASETIEVSESNLDLYVLPKWGTWKALDIQPTDVEMWFEFLNTQGATKPLKWGTIQKIKSVMSLVYSHALRNKLLPVAVSSNPFRGAVAGGARCKQTSSYEATVVSPEQVIAILEHLDEPTTQMEWMIGFTPWRDRTEGRGSFRTPVG
jgi:hypothetical protein